MEFRKYFGCTARTRTLIIGYYCILIYTTALSVSIYIQAQSATIDMYLIPLNSGLPFMLIFISLLIYGVYKSKPNFMLPWLIIKFLSLVVLSIFLVILCGTTIVSSLKQKQYELFIPFTLTLFAIGMFWFLHVLVYRYYKDLTEEPIKNNDDLKVSMVSKE